METLQPKLRFPEFKGNWQPKILDDIANINMGQSPSSTSYNTEKIGLPLIQGNADIRNRNTFPRNWTSEPTKICEIGDLILTVRAPVGAVAKSNHKACIGRGVCSIKNKSNSNIDFIYQFLLDFENKWSALEQGSTFTAVSGNEIKNININVPSKEEQTKVAIFLSSVDEKLNLLKEKKALLEDYKKGIMQKIFNQEIRFKDDNCNDFENWEEKSLESILKKIVDNRGKTPPVEKEGIPLLEVNSIGNKSINYNVVSKFVNDETYNSWFRVYLEKNDVIFSTVGNTALCSFYGDNIKACIAQNLVALRFTSEYGLFMYYLLTEKNNNEKFKSIEMGAVQPSVKVSQMIKLKFNIPKLEEQIKIANFLSAIDEKIELVSNQIQETQEYKKGLLQQMFV